MEWWGGAFSRPQYPCSTFPHGLHGEFFFVSLFGKMLFPCLIESLMLRHCHFIMCFCWNLGHCMVDHVVILALGNFWIVVFFLSWFNLNNVWWVMNFGNVGNLWCCWMNFDLNFGDIEVVRNLWCRLGWIHLWCMWEILLACVKFISWTWQNFVGMEIFFCGYGKILWVSDFGLWNIFVRYVMLDHGNFCDCDFGHGKFSVVILIMENFWLWFWSWGFFGHVCTMWFLVWEFFWSCDFGMRIFWTWFLAWNEYIFFFLLVWKFGMEWDFFVGMGFLFLTSWWWVKLCFVESQKSR